MEWVLGVSGCAALVSLLALVKALIGQRVGRERSCRKCRFSLEGLPERAICPECGAAADERRPARIGRRKRSIGAIGLRALALVVTMAVLSGVWILGFARRDQPWSVSSHILWARHVVGSINAIERAELNRRILAGNEVAAWARDQVIESELASGSDSELVRALLIEQKLTPDQARRYLDLHWSITLSTRPRMNEKSIAMVVLRLPPITSSATNVRSPFLTIEHAPLDPRSNAGATVTPYQGQDYACYLSVIEPGPPGERAYVLPIKVTYRGVSWTITRSVRLIVCPANQPTTELIADDAFAPTIARLLARTCIEVRSGRPVRASLGGGTSPPQAFLWVPELRVDRPLAFRTKLEYGRADGSLATIDGPAVLIDSVDKLTLATAITFSDPLTLLRDRPKQTRLTLIADAEVIKRSLWAEQAWGGTVVLERVNIFYPDEDGTQPGSRPLK